ncbi:hypothetical protein [Peredibacter starrii]|uniref:Uncharacterized protein n=1 Tax=Peredibacter starrii TaxID=28202 RepID=A0AAX4HKH2_9BACT|nr:hypothetical protein [Peredibacter starrii]WPU63730.1 hypothetical protein SOO65_13630 [Peredibacter starrii]
MLKKMFVVGLLLIASMSLLLFQNFTTSTPQLSDLRTPYFKSLDASLNTWLNLDIITYSTGHVCKATTVSSGVNASQIGKPYLTPKIHRLAALLKDLSAIHPYVDQPRQEKIVKISKKVYQYLYRQIDWNQKLFKDDYGLCFKGIATSYAFLTTPEVVIGLYGLYKILPATDPDAIKLKSIIPTFVVSHLKSSDGWMTPIGGKVEKPSANFMGLNLSVLSILNDVDPNNAYFVNLKHRLTTDYAWIRSSWVNYASEQVCGEPMLYGGWSHQAPSVVARMNGRELDCDYFKQDNLDPFAINLRSYYLQKVSYHSIITNGLLDLKKLLVTRGACNLVAYGSQGTCVEIDVIANGASGWVLELMKADGSIPTAYQSYEIDEFNYFNDKSGNRPGIKSVMNTIKNQKPESIYYGIGFPDNGSIRTKKSLKAYKDRIYKLYDYEVRRGTVIELGDSFFIAERMLQ